MPVFPSLPAPAREALRLAPKPAKEDDPDEQKPASPALPQQATPQEPVRAEERGKRDGEASQIIELLKQLLAEAKKNNKKGPQINITDADLGG